MEIHPFKVAYPHVDRIGQSDAFFERSKDEFHMRYAAGDYGQYASDALYVYEIRTPERTHTGLVALNATQDFLEGKIKKHEKTLRAREEQYNGLLHTWLAMVKPVLLTYAPVAAIQTWLDAFKSKHKPFLEIPTDLKHEQHCVWAVRKDTDIEELTALFAAIPATYIADGHHRTTTVARFFEEGTSDLDFSRLFSAYFAADQLAIKGYHRTVQAPEGFVIAAFLDQLRAQFVVEQLSAPRMPSHTSELIVVWEEVCYSIVWKSGLTADPLMTDATLLNQKILQPLLGIADVRTDQRVRYIEGAKTLPEILDVLRNNPLPQIGFLLYPLAFEALAAISDLNETLPPKSTWFEPRLKSGLLVQFL